LITDKRGFVPSKACLADLRLVDHAQQTVSSLPTMQLIGQQKPPCDMELSRIHSQASEAVLVSKAAAEQHRSGVALGT
jgi:hypothetical protein